MLGAAVAATFALAGSALADPRVDFSWQPSQPGAGDEVTFNATGAPSGWTYSWDLNGDGTFGDATGPSAKYTFPQAGKYKVQVVASGGEDDAGASHDVAVSSGLKASFTWSPQNPAPGQQATFTSTSTAKGSTIQAYEWDLDGDKRFNDWSGPTATRAFDTLGPHTVGLRVTDGTGERSFSFDTVQVTEAAPPPPPAQAAPPAPQPAGRVWLNPFPSIRIRGFATAGGVHLTMLAVRAPAGSKLRVKCSGSDRCPNKRTRLYTMSADRMRLNGLERFLPAGTRIEVYIWKDGEVGKYTRLFMRRNVAPKRVDKCLFPGRKRPGRC
jgi:hypothetical protein